MKKEGKEWAKPIALDKRFNATSYTQELFKETVKIDNLGEYILFFNRSMKVERRKINNHTGQLSFK